MPASRQFAEVQGKRIAYLEAGTGDPIVLLHGNPTSSYLWRNVIPELENCGRVIVPDLIGQGESDKLPASEGPDRYSFEVAFDYLDGLLRAIDVDSDITWVIHDWGSGLGFHWAKHNPDAVKGIAYMEAIVMPITWDDWPESARGIFQGFRSSKGEDLCLERNLFIEAVLPVRSYESSPKTRWRRIGRRLTLPSTGSPRSTGPDKSPSTESPHRWSS